MSRVKSSHFLGIEGLPRYASTMESLSLLDRNAIAITITIAWIIIGRFFLPSFNASTPSVTSVHEETEEPKRLGRTYHGRPT